MVAVIQSRRSPILVTDDFYLRDNRWCWKYICPGYTTIEEASSLLVGMERVENTLGRLKVRDMGDSYTFLYDPVMGSGPVEVLEIESRFAQITLGQAILRFGTPIASFSGTVTKGPIGGQTITFENGVYITLDGSHSQITPASRVKTIVFFTEDYDDNLMLGTNMNRWHGFTLLRFRR
jgi:hypothetical protein